MSLLDTVRFITNHPLNQHQKLRSLARFVKWQIASRLAPGGLVHQWINGSKFLVRSGETGLTGNIYTGLHEFQEMGFLLHVLREEDLFVDVGANVGSYTILACAAVGARGIAFEPVPETYKRLCYNIRLNHLEQQVNCVNMGVGSEQGVIMFSSNADTTNHALKASEQCDSAINVDSTTLDIALKNQSPAIIKIDVEGYETPVLKGAEEILCLQSVHSLIIELNGSGKHYGYNELQILAMMSDHGFQPYSYNPLNRTLVRLQGKNKKSSNTLFIREIAHVEERLRTAPISSFHGVQL